ncbi:MspA protein [Williamsia limnetica]|uniref:MspA protein n=1 Tax=Williamsia limnetica TaxID=882452 RepID=A0A318RRH2_WILLI|nr:MspA family porin [Williamsia limnetica]PYE19280.1 MspA protein [Williamsia limnetica]
MKNTTSRRIAAAAAISGVTAVALATMGAGAAAAGPLPGGKTTQVLDDGTAVTVSLFGESVNITPSMAAIPTSRNVWLNGKIKVDVAGGAEGGNIEAGYIVGCQLNFGANAGATGGIGGALTETGIAVGEPEAGAEAGFSLAPGEATYVAFFSDEDGNNTGFDFEGATGGLAYSQETFQIDSCAGFAEAKAFVKVTVETESTTGIVTLYGKPFSIG